MSRLGVLFVLAVLLAGGTVVVTSWEGGPPAAPTEWVQEPVQEREPEQEPAADPTPRATAQPVRAPKRDPRALQQALADRRRDALPPWDTPVMALQLDLRQDSRPDMSNAGLADASPRGSRAGGKRVIALMFGQLRTLEHTAPFILRNGLEPYAADVFACVVPEHAVFGLSAAESSKVREAAHSNSSEGYFAALDNDLGADRIVHRVMVRPVKVHKNVASLQDVLSTLPSDEAKADSDFRFPVEWNADGSVARWSSSPAELAQTQASRKIKYTQYIEAKVAAYQCWTEFEHWARETGQSYDVVLRQRFDVALFDPLPDLAKVPEDALLIPDGYNWGGFCDRLAIGPTHVMEIYFHGLLYELIRSGQLPPSATFSTPWKKFEAIAKQGNGDERCLIARAVETVLFCQLYLYRPQVTRFPQRYCTVRFNTGDAAPVCDGDTATPSSGGQPYGPYKKSPVHTPAPLPLNPWFNQLLREGLPE